MIDLAKKFFGRVTAQRSTLQEPATHDVRIAACALFLEMAGIDGEFDASERERILIILKREYGLSDDLADALDGVAENIIVGQPVSLGTGAVELIMSHGKPPRGKKKGS